MSTLLTHSYDMIFTPLKLVKDYILIQIIVTLGTYSWRLKVWTNIQEGAAFLLEQHISYNNMITVGL